MTWYNMAQVCITKEMMVASTAEHATLDLGSGSVSTDLHTGISVTCDVMVTHLLPEQPKGR
jgi:hypothetical protein